MIELTKKKKKDQYQHQGMRLQLLFILSGTMSMYFTERI